MASRRRDRAMLTTEDVAHLLSLHVNTVRRWANKGILKTYRIGPRGDRRFQHEDLTRFLIEQSGRVERANTE